MGAAGLTPEVISGLMYTGPGSAPMVAAAAAWNGLASELHTTAVGVESVISALTASWTGPSAAAMAGAATPYVTWLHTTAVQAEKTAIQANAAAAAFDTAFAATVPPPMIALNRTQLMVLVATNLLGQNAAAIAANEAQYAAMWAQDLAMFATYTVSSVTALQMEPFAPPPKTTNEAGQATQGANAAKNMGTMGVQQALARVGDTAEGAPQLAPFGAQALNQPIGMNPFAAVQPLAAATPGESILQFLIPDLAGLLGGIIGALGAVASSVGIAVSAAAWADAVPGVEENERRLDHLHHEHHEMLDIMGHPRPEHWRPGMWPWTEGNMGHAGTAGGLSVPPAWASNAPAIQTAAYALPVSGMAGVPAVAGPSGVAFRDLALASMLGRALAGSASPAPGQLAGIKSGKVTTVAKAAAEAAVAEAAASPAARTGIAAELRQLAQLRDEGVLTGDEFLDQKRRLLEP